ncbi:beta-xylosidase [Actinokineospora xionganensis]|uniref:Beta-xylosidase n=1 Tax=Actinokineospora xionganensis TaxID=2684470 RepID=A0ABR7L795_9PSEU|nr:beta-xylosidase [Actinokineospora xionganensis]MBC6448562.1 beta-xylosidase [Actinokineospora xionganensis]
MSSPRRRAASILLIGGLLTGCTAAVGEAGPSQPTTTSVTPSEEPPPAQLTLRTDRPRQSPGVVAAGGGDAPYNYGPTLMLDGNRYRMWWCSQLGVANPPGDDILLAESTSLDSRFVGPDGSPATPVFSGSTTGFDGMHTCDPSVIKVRGIYYMYYTGAAGDHANGNSIGVATSPDGRVWSRGNGGRPIVTAARNVLRDNIYGAGQPAAVHVDGWFYLMFTDTTGSDAGWNGAGQFLLRAKDPAFTVDVETLSPGGFREFSSTAARMRSVVDAFSADLMWVPTLGAFAIAHETEHGTTITFWDKDFRRSPARPIHIPGPWREGPGLVRDPEGHAVRSVEDPCDRVPVDLVRATRTGHAPTDLVHFGADINNAGACDDPARAPGALRGFAMPSPQRTIDVVVEGGLLRVERRAVAERLAIRVLDHRVPALESLPVRARLDAAAKVVTADSRLAFVLDEHLWPFTDPTLATLNSSVPTPITARRWRDYADAPALGP